MWAEHVIIRGWRHDSHGSRALRLHIAQFTWLAGDRECDRAAADRAVFDRGVVALGGVDGRREILAAPRAADFGFDEISHTGNYSFSLSRGASLHRSSRL